jgi:hypothetical protein
MNVVAHHAADAHRYIADMLQAMANGQRASMSMDQIHAGNAAGSRRARRLRRSSSTTKAWRTHRLERAGPASARHVHFFPTRRYAKRSTGTRVTVGVLVWNGARRKRALPSGYTRATWQPNP